MLLPNVVECPSKLLYGVMGRISDAEKHILRLRSTKHVLRNPMLYLDLHHLETGGSDLHLARIVLLFVGPILAHIQSQSVLCHGSELRWSLSRFVSASSWPSCASTEYRLAARLTVGSKNRQRVKAQQPPPQCVFSTVESQSNV